MNTIDFKLCPSIACALINDDRSGLNDTEEAKLDEFIEQVAQDHGAGYFASSDDIHPDIFEKCEALDVVSQDLYVLPYVLTGTDK